MEIEQPLRVTPTANASAIPPHTSRPATALPSFG